MARAKTKQAFRTISEVSDWLDTPTHVLRFWETRFTQIKPVKGAGNRRYYRPADMELLSGLKQLLHEEGLSIKDAQKLLREKGVRHVATLGRPPSPDPDPGPAPGPTPPLPDPAPEPGPGPRAAPETPEPGPDRPENPVPTPTPDRPDTPERELPDPGPDMPEHPAPTPSPDRPVSPPQEMPPPDLPPMPGPGPVAMQADLFAPRAETQIAPSGRVLSKIPADLDPLRKRAKKIAPLLKRLEEVQGRIAAKR